MRARAWICGPVLSGGQVSSQISETGLPSMAWKSIGVGEFADGHDQLVGAVALSVGDGQAVADAGRARGFAFEDGIEDGLGVLDFPVLCKKCHQFTDGFILGLGLHGHKRCSVA